MVFNVAGFNSFCNAVYQISSLDGMHFHCLLKQYTGKTCYDKPADELNLYKCQGRWKSDKKANKELTSSLGKSIDNHFLEF